MVDFTPLPKVSLHEHIDGSLRPHTLWALCHARGIPLPCPSADGVAGWMLANARTGQLATYLQGFRHTVAAMATPAACERVARELAEDAHTDGCVLAEFRFAPQLFGEWGLGPEAALEAVLRGLANSPVPCGLIVCGMRHLGADTTRAAAQLAVRYQADGVVGFDLAGPELGFPPGEHAAALHLARDGGLGITVHAGEADAGHRVLEAARLGATRIGHGVRVVDDPAWAQEARERGLHFEVCPSSNVHTGAANAIATHPIKAMLDAGLSVSCAPDNRLVSGTTLSRELALLHTELGLDLPTLVAMQHRALAASFLPSAVKRAAAHSLTPLPNPLSTLSPP
ncbi:MAG: adenosine deaminase [Burkholderiaceae bacterium]